MPELTDVTTPLESLRTALDGDSGDDLEPYLEAVVDAYERRFPQEEELNASVAHIGRPSAGTTSEGFDAASAYNSRQLSARLRRGKLLREIGLVATDGGAGSLADLGDLVDAALVAETSLSESVRELERTTSVDSVSLPPELATGTLQFSTPAVEPGTEVTARVQYRHVGGDAVSGISATVDTTAGLELLDSSLTTRSLSSDERGEWRGTLAATESGHQRLSLGLTADDANGDSVEGSLSVRTEAEVRAHRERTRDRFDPLSDEDDAIIAGGSVFGAAGIAAAYYAFGRWDRDDEPSTDGDEA